MSPKSLIIAYKNLFPRESLRSESEIFRERERYRGFSSMEIPEKLLKLKFHILSAVGFSIVILSLCYLAPSLLDILKYFWPLLVSTALFLATIVVFGRISPPLSEAHGEKAGEGLLDYVASEPEHFQPFVGGESGKAG